MANNIVSAISEFLTPEIIGKVATASGLDRSMVQKATGAAVPTILSSLTDLVTQPGGARKLMGVLADQPDNPLQSSSINPAQAASSGNNLLSSLLGGSAPNLIASAIGRFLGISGSSMQTVLGMLAPVVLGGIGRVQRAQGLDANGLSQMLLDQKDNIASAMPAGLANVLGTGTFADATEARRPAVLTREAPSARPKAEDARGVSWPYWALALVALAGLLWSLMPSENGTREASVAANPPPGSIVVRSDDGKAVYITRPAANWTSIGASPNEYVNRDIYNARGETIGTVRDVLVANDGKAAAAVIRVGRYLGIGDKEIAIPFSALRIEQRDNGRRIVVDVMKDTLQSAPPYEGLPPAKQ